MQRREHRPAQIAPRAAHYDETGDFPYDLVAGMARLGLFALPFPEEIGGAGDGHNPEQLFALGYSSCYGQAIMLIAKKYGLDGQAARVTCEVTLDQKDGGFGLAVELKVSIPGADKDKLQQLVEEAHTVCPYSKATKGNIPVKLTVV